MNRVGPACRRRTARRRADCLRRFVPGLAVSGQCFLGWAGFDLVGRRQIGFDSTGFDSTGQHLTGPGLIDFGLIDFGLIDFGLIDLGRVGLSHFGWGLGSFVKGRPIGCRCRHLHCLGRLDRLAAFYRCRLAHFHPAVVALHRRKNRRLIVSGSTALVFHCPGCDPKRAADRYRKAHRRHPAARVLADLR